MEVNEKIKLFRLTKDWTQEEVAEKLDMSLSGYGSIERGETDIQLSRLKQLAALFAVSLPELLEADEKTVFNFKNAYQSNLNSTHCPNLQLLPRTPPTQN